MDVGGVTALGLDRLLAAKQYMKTFDAALLALFAHNAAHGIADRFENVGKAQALGMQLVAAAHGAHQANVVVLSIFGNGELGGDGVNGVDDVVELATCLLKNARKEFVDVIAQQVFSTLDDGGGWIDIVDHGFHHVYLALADGAVKGDGLAIDIAWRDDVFIQNYEMANAAAGKCFTAVGAHAAAAEYQHRGVSELVECLAAHDDFELGITRLDESSSGFGHKHPPMGKQIVF